MKIYRKLFLIVIFSLLFFGSFLIPRTTAQEWTYNGANTERIPEFSVYPSERYIYTVSEYGTIWNHTIVEIGDAIIGNTFAGMTSYPPYYGTFTNGTVISIGIYTWNMTYDDPYLVPGIPDDAVYWNGTAFLTSGSSFSPINESTGTVTEDILDSLIYFYHSMYTDMFGGPFEHQSVYPNIYSIALWNDTHNDAQLHMNLTQDGILQKQESYNMLYGYNMTLYSRPAQLAPDFSFTTESGSLTLNSTNFKLNMSILDADNNNDQEIDTDYLYRIQNGTTWSDWAVPPSQLNWDLGNITAGGYDITIEVKNMYGVTQKDITIQYTPTEDDDGDGDGNGDDGDEVIPGYPLYLLLTFFVVITSILIKRKRKKLP